MKLFFLILYNYTMASNQLNLNNTETVIANSVHLLVGTELKDLYDIF